METSASTAFWLAVLRSSRQSLHGALDGIEDHSTLPHAISRATPSAVAKIRIAVKIHIAMVQRRLRLSYFFERNGAGKRKNHTRTSVTYPNCLCVAEKSFCPETLSSGARLLCCGPLDAAMHNRNSEASGIGFDFDVEQVQHQTVAIDVG